MNGVSAPKRLLSRSRHRAPRLPHHALERAVGGIAIVDASPTGKIGFATSKAEMLLVKYFGARARHHLPELLLRWAKPVRGKRLVPRPPWSVRRGHEQLLVRLTGSRDGAFQFLFDEKSDDASCLQSLGLTRREAEVLLWMTRGKINRDIAVILACKTATVSKHTERIFSKLGVETRTAAAVIATEAGI